VAFEEARVSAKGPPSRTVASVGVSKKRKNEEDKPQESAKKQFRSAAVSRGKQTPDTATSSNSKYDTQTTDNGINSANLASIDGIKRKPSVTCG
jgi:hypothetical protein